MPKLTKVNSSRAPYPHGYHRLSMKLELKNLCQFETFQLHCGEFSVRLMPANGVNHECECGADFERSCPCFLSFSACL